MTLTEALFVITEDWKQPVCTPIAEWLNTSTYIEWNTIKKDEVFFLMY